MKQMFFIIMLSLLPIISFAQKNEDVMVEPEPHRLDEYFKEKNLTKVKTVYIISKNKKTNFTNDTLNVYFYNKQGLKIRTIRYEQNRPASNLEIIYDEKGNQKKSLYTQTKVKERTGVTEFKYDDQNQLIAEEYKSVFAGNPERTITKNYKFIDNKLAEKTIYQTNTLSQTDSFIYDKNKLVLHKQTYSSGNNNYENIYTYDESEQLIKRETKGIYTPTGTPELVAIVKYEYENGKLKSITESEWKNKQNNEPVLTYYTYGENGKVSKMRVEYKSFYSEVDYEYSGQKIISINVVTNTDNNAYMKFWTATYGHSVDKMPFKYKEQFDYDPKDNLTGKKIFMNDDLINETMYVIEYH